MCISNKKENKRKITVGWKMLNVDKERSLIKSPYADCVIDPENWNSGDFGFGPRKCATYDENYVGFFCFFPKKKDAILYANESKITGDVVLKVEVEGVEFVGETPSIKTGSKLVLALARKMKLLENPLKKEKTV